MHSTKLPIVFTLIITACATTDEASTGAVESALEDPCRGDEASFDNYYAVTECAKSNPELFQAAIHAIVSYGGTCTATDGSKTCTSIEPIDDKQTRERSWIPFRCTGMYCRHTEDGTWKCDSVWSCCLRVNDGYVDELCFPPPVVED